MEKRVPGQNDELQLTFALNSANSALALLSGPLTKHVSHYEVDATIGFNVEGSGEVGSNAQVLVYDVDPISGARASTVGQCCSIDQPEFYPCSVLADQYKPYH